jgi:hypothetical protein
MPSRLARWRLAQAVGTQFDTSVVAAFEAVLTQGTEEYRCACGDGFEFGERVNQPHEAALALSVTR